MKSLSPTLEHLMKFGIPPTYEYQTIWDPPRIVMIDPGNKKYWLTQLHQILSSRLKVLESEYPMHIILFEGRPSMGSHNFTLVGAYQRYIRGESNV